MNSELVTIAPAIDALTSMYWPARSAASAMTSSVRLPSVALSSPPTASPVFAATDSVAWLSSAASGTIARTASANRAVCADGASSSVASTTGTNTSIHSRGYAGFLDQRVHGLVQPRRVAGVIFRQPRRLILTWVNKPLGRCWPLGKLLQNRCSDRRLALSPRLETSLCASKRRLPCQTALEDRHAQERGWPWRRRKRSRGWSAPLDLRARRRDRQVGNPRRPGPDQSRCATVARGGAFVANKPRGDARRETAGRDAFAQGRPWQRGDAGPDYCRRPCRRGRRQRRAGAASRRLAGRVPRSEGQRLQDRHQCGAPRRLSAPAVPRGHRDPFRGAADTRAWQSSIAATSSGFPAAARSDLRMRWSWRGRGSSASAWRSYRA